VSLQLLVCYTADVRSCGGAFNWAEAACYKVDPTSAAQQAKIASDRAAAVATLTANVYTKLTARHFKSRTGLRSHGFVQCSDCHGDVHGPLLQCMHCQDCSLCVTCQYVATSSLHEGHVFKVVQPPAAADSYNNSRFAAIRARTAARAAAPVRRKRRWWVCMLFTSWLFFILFITLYYES
jgi:hypothetical protein